MGSRKRSPAGARHPRSPLPRQQTVRDKLKNVQRKQMPPIPAPGSGPKPADGGAMDAAPASRTRRMFAFSRGYYRVQ